MKKKKITSDETRMKDSSFDFSSQLLLQFWEDVYEYENQSIFMNNKLMHRFDFGLQGNAPRHRCKLHSTLSMYIS